MAQYTHTCSCGKVYTDNDPDLYFCPACVAQRKLVAEQVNRNIGSRPKKDRKTDLQIALTRGRTINSASGGQATFVKAGDLGISF